MRSLCILMLIIFSQSSFADLRAQLLCTTSLNPLSTPTVTTIVHGRNLNDTYFIDQVPGAENRVNLDMNFSFLDPFSDRIPAIGSNLRLNSQESFFRLARTAREDLGLTFIDVRTAFGAIEPRLAASPDWIDHFEVWMSRNLPDQWPEELHTALMEAHQRIVGSYAKSEWEQRRNHILFGLNFAAWRGPVFSSNALAYSENQESSQQFQELVMSPAVRALERTYSAYSNQGPERADIVPMVREQDIEEAGQFVRFMISRYVKPLAYAQVLVSQSPDQPLHVEVAWKELVEEFIDRQEGEVIGELGRLHVIYPEDEVGDEYTELMGDEDLVDNKAFANLVATELLFQKAFSWINSDARLDKLLVQINVGVERVMLRNGFPLHYGRKMELPKSYEGQRLKEVVYVFEREALLRIEEFLLVKGLERWLTSVLEQPYLTSMIPRLLPSGFPVRFEYNELEAFRRSGAYEAIFAQPFPFEYIPPGHEPGIGIQFGFDMVPDAIEALRRLLDQNYQ